MRIGTDIDVVWDGDQFILTVFKPGKEPGKTTKKITYHTTVEQLESKLVTLETGRIVNQKPSAGSFRDVVDEAAKMVAMKLKFAAAMK